MMARGALWVVALLLITLFFPFSNAEAKRRLPQAASATGTSGGGVKVSGTGRVGVSVKFRGDRRAIVVNFSNLESASSVSYDLIYTTNGISEGAGGTVTASLGSASRELLFGTCSKGVCRYHTNIKNAKFVVTITLPSGKRIVKSFRLRV